MDPTWDEKSVFLAALQLNEADRAAFLDGACPDDAARKRIESLLRHYERSTLPRAPGDGANDPLRFDEFRVIRKIGEGGMGVVYLAEDMLLGRQVALKALAPHMAGSEQALARFKDEARCAAALEHPGVAPVYRLGEFEGRHYIVSAYVDGPTLAEVIKEERERRTEGTSTLDRRGWHRRCAELVAQVADALEAAHRAGIVHRDVKPSNILLDSKYGPRLTDFGIAKHLTDDSHTRTTDVIGSCHYMSPEQASISKTGVDGRSDIFSLGVVLYEMLALRRPFEGDDPPRILSAVISEQPTRLREIDARVPRDLETICGKAMEKRPNDRYQSAAHFAADLRSYVDGRPILAKPPSAWRKGREWARRHRRGIAVAALVVLVIGLVGAGMVISRQRDATFAWLQIEAAGEACRVYVQGMDETTRHPEAARRGMGRTPTGMVRMDPGVYRITLVRESDEAFAEFNVVLDETGREAVRLVRGVGSADEVGRGESAEGALGGVLRTVESVEGEGGMLRVEGGAYRLKGRAPVHPVVGDEVEVETFLIDARQVSNAAYKAFVDATGHRMPYAWQAWGYPEDAGDLPVIWVSMEDAEAYARWAGKRLATVREWQAAARGREGRLYPSGNESPSEARAGENVTWLSPEEKFAHYLRETTAVGERTAWDPPGGLIHSFSNVRELTGTVGSGGGSAYLVGRAWTDDPRGKTLADVLSGPRVMPSPNVGFRCAKSVDLRLENQE